MPLILELANEASTDLRTNLIVYIFVNSGLKRNEILKIINMAPVAIKNRAMTTLDYLLEEGRKIGIELGREEGLLEGRYEERGKAVRNMLLKGSTVEFICEVLEVSPDYVDRIRVEMGGDR